MSSIKLTYCNENTLGRTTMDDELYGSGVFASHVNRFSVNDTTLTINETIVLDTEMLFWMFGMAGVELEDKSGAIMSRSKTVYRRITMGSGLAGAWVAEGALSWKQFEGFNQRDKDTLAKYLGNDTTDAVLPWQTFLKFTDDSVGGTIDTKPVDNFIDTWNGFYKYDPDSSDRNIYAVTLRRIDDRTVRLIGNYTGDTVTMSFNDTVFSLSGSITYESSAVGNANWTHYDMPKECPTNDDPGWYNNFLLDNKKGAISDRPPDREIE